MKKQTLREISKFLAGLVLGDFLWGWWILAKGLAPLSFLGVGFTANSIVAWMVFDLIVFAFLFHYGWKIKDSGHSDGERVFHRIAGIIFGLVALAHLLRLILNMQITLLSWHTPAWVSAVATIVAAFLSYTSFKLTKK